MLPAGLNVDIDDVVNVLDDLRDVRSGGGGGGLDAGLAFILR